jgi:hypothetical protein
VRAVRSTLLLSSRASLTSNGFFDECERDLPDRSKIALGEIIAGTWLPIDLVMEHYGACDLLELSRAQQVALGRTNCERLSGTLLGTLAKLARSAGTTPGMLIEQFPDSGPASSMGESCPPRYADRRTWMWPCAHRRS